MKHAGNRPMIASPHATVPIVSHLLSAYELGHGYLPNIPKDARYSLGVKIDALFIEAAEPLFAATYLNREEKLPYLLTATTKLDLVKFFLQALWEIRALDNKKYAALSEKLDEIGRMLGGWIRQLQKQNSPA